MKETVRHEVLNALGELSLAFPEWRLGQMVANLAVLARGATVESVWDVEDEELLTVLREQVEHHRDRLASPVRS